MKQQIIILVVTVCVFLSGAGGAEFSPTRRPTLGATLEEFTSDINHEQEDADDGGDQVAPLKSDEINDGGPVEALRSDDGSYIGHGNTLGVTFRGDCAVLGETLAIGLLKREDPEIVLDKSNRILPERRPHEPVRLDFWHEPKNIFFPKLFAPLGTQKYAEREFLKRFQFVLRTGTDDKIGIMVSMDRKLHDHLGGYFGSSVAMRILGLDIHHMN